MKLYRPPIPVEVKLRVALRQIGEMFVDDVVELSRHHRMMGARLDEALCWLSSTLNCERKALRLDHNPALGLRKKRRTGKTIMVGGEPVDVLIYTPPANDPDSLIYRSHHAHHIKTNVRGDGAQFSDTSLMKRERRRKKKASKRVAKGGLPKRKSIIPTRVNPWPPKGSRPFRGRDDGLRR